MNKRLWKAFKIWIFGAMLALPSCLVYIVGKDILHELSSNIWLIDLLPIAIALGVGIPLCLLLAQPLRREIGEFLEQ